MSRAEGVKLTKAQREMLAAPRRDADGGIVRHALSNAGPDSRTAEALCRKGLIEWVAGHVFGGSWRITPAGREALSPPRHGREEPISETPRGD